MISIERSTPGGVSAAIAVFGVSVREQPDAGAAMDAYLEGFCGKSVAVGASAVRPLGAVDHGLVVRWAEDRADLCPHGGRAVSAAVLRAAVEAGAVEHESEPANDEAAWLDAIARCPSERGLDLLLRSRPGEGAGSEDAALAASRRVLMEPPLVATVGPTNVGKSSLLNALAGRGVAVAADEPGVTRDAVGAVVELDGLTVRWLDTPGVLGDTESGVDRDAAAISAELTRSATLVLTCDDAVDGRDPAGGGRVKTLALRCDRGEARWDADLRVSAVEPASVAELARMVRELLIPEAAIADPAPWSPWRA